MSTVRKKVCLSLLLLDGIDYFFLAVQCSMWNLSSSTRHGTCRPAEKAWSYNPWTTKEILDCIDFNVGSLTRYNSVFVMKI